MQTKEQTTFCLVFVNIVLVKNKCIFATLCETDSETFRDYFIEAFCISTKQRILSDILENI